MTPDKRTGPRGRGPVAADRRGNACPQSTAALFGVASDHAAYEAERQRRQAMYGAALAWHIVHRLGEGFDWNETAA